MTTMMSLTGWAYLAFMALVFLEGPTTTLVGGALAAQGVLDWRGVLLAALTANLLADLFWYAAGQGLARRGRWWPRLQQHYPLVRWWVAAFRQQAAVWLLAAKFTFNGIPGLLAAGLAQVPWRRIAGVVVLAEALWIGLLNLVGYLGWRHVQAWQAGLRYLAVGGGIALLVGGVYLVRRVAAARLTARARALAAASNPAPASPATPPPAR